MNPDGSFSVRVMAAECHRQMLFATFFSTRNFDGGKVEKMKIHSLFNQIYNSRILRLAAVMFVALTMCSLISCGKKHTATSAEISGILDAAKNGDLETAKTLLNANPDLVNARDEGTENPGYTPLHWAVFNGHKDIAELLLANKADVNAKTKYDTTPLILAAGRGDKDAVELLLANKADVNAKDSAGLTPLILASMNGRANVLDLLLANKADVNAKDNNGVTPLHAAVLRKHEDVAEFLRQHGGTE
jgi:ankyrin repeat protein